MMIQAGKEDYFIRALEEDAMEVECLLVEPETGNASVDGVFFCPEENLQCTEIVHLPCTEIVHLPCEFGLQDTNAAGGREDTSELKVLDVLPDKVGAENIQAVNGLSTACEDYLLDTGFAESFAYLDYGFNDGLHLANSGLISSNIGTFGTSNTLLDIVAMPDRNNIIFSCKYEPETLDEAKSLICSASCESPNNDQLEDGLTPSLRGLSSEKNEKDTFSTPDFTSDELSSSSQSMENSESKPVCRSEEIDSAENTENNITTFIKQKRSRKPTRRYIDDSSYYTSRQRGKRLEILHSTSKNKNLGVRCLRNRHNMRSKEKLHPADELFGEAIQVPFDFKAPKECPKSQTAILPQAQMERCSKELSPAESEDEPETRVRSYMGSGQRKHHKLWTIPEVRKLIDGVSCFGVGRWTEIKKLLFSSSVHRTPVDLKDKWRNLLKAASSPGKQSKREDERKRNQPWRPLPKSLLCRVRELAMVHPYPREAKSKISKSNLSYVHHLSSPDLPSRTQGIRIQQNSFA